MPYSDFNASLGQTLYRNQTRGTSNTSLNSQPACLINAPITVHFTRSQVPGLRFAWAWHCVAEWAAHDVSNALRSVETSGTTHQTLCHIPENLHLQPPCCMRISNLQLSCCLHESFTWRTFLLCCTCQIPPSHCDRVPAVHVRGHTTC